MKSTLLALALLLTPAVAAADTVDVEIVESAPKQDDQVLAFTLALGEHGCATAESFESAAAYELKVCRDSTGTLSFEVRTGARRLRVASKLTTGKRVVVGKIARGAEATEIAATLR